MFRGVLFNSLYIHLIAYEIKYNRSETLHELKIIIMKSQIWDLSLSASTMTPGCPGQEGFTASRG